MSELIDKMYHGIPPERKRRFEYADEIAEYLHTVLEKNEITQKELAGRMNMKPAQLNRYINGEANLNLETIARLEIALGERILKIKQPQKNKSGRTVTATIEHYERKGEKEFKLYNLRTSTKNSGEKTEKKRITKEVDNNINPFGETA